MIAHEARWKSYSLATIVGCSLAVQGSSIGEEIYATTFQKHQFNHEFDWTIKITAFINLAVLFMAGYR